MVSKNSKSVASKVTDKLVVIDDEPSSNVSNFPSWKILIADDDEDVHLASQLALDDYHFMGKGLKIFNTYSAKDMIQLLKKEKDIAIIILDVVMESDEAGLTAVRQIREELHNKEIRIILRTGQPGFAPEYEIINSYDINDYKTKSELTQSKLLATITTALRSYKQIIELREIQNELRRINMFPDRNPQPVCQLDLQGNVIYANPGSKKLLKKFNIVSDDVSLLFPANIQDILAELRGTTKEHLTSEYKYGKGIFQCHVQYLRDISFFNLYIVEITERKKLEKELLISQKMQTVGLLTGGIAHDFNNIQGIILGYSNIAMKHIKALNDDQLENYLNAIISSSERASKLVNEMLLFSRIGDETASAVEVGKIINDVVGLLKGSLPTSMFINVSIADDLPFIFIDPIQLEQIIMNICINGRDAMNEVGELDIKVKPLSITTSQEEIPCAMQSQNSERTDVCFCEEKHLDKNNGEYVEVAIKDTGTGILKENLEHIFEPFFTTKDVGKGTGLGLSMIHGIIKSANGHIIVETEEGNGTLFRFIFKGVEATVENESISHADNKVILQEGGLILLVDDEPALLDCTEDFLISNGYEVKKSISSEQALNMFNEMPEAFDLVITDQTMPVMTGVELSKNILKIRPDIPIILCTGHSVLVNESSAIELGISSYLSKPTDPNLLLSEIHKHLSVG
jgi:signal transduction histidine kinase/CheY-like chemotaxis protein